MKEKVKKTEKFDPPDNQSAIGFCGNPENAVEMINTYGTYNIQATADTSNEFPAIAQGNPPMAQKPLGFVKDGKQRKGR
ncbi:MAG: hypothetical protein ACLU40_00330 [Acutalibacteraceae bacterium]